MTAKECPTDLIAKQRHAGLSPWEKRLLDEHLRRCGSCRTWHQLGRDFDSEAPMSPDDAALLTRITRRLPQRAQLVAITHEASSNPSSAERKSTTRVTTLWTTRRRRALFAGVGLGLLATAAAAAVVGLNLKPHPPEVDPQWVRSTTSVEHGPSAGSPAAGVQAGETTRSDPETRAKAHNEGTPTPSKPPAVAVAPGLNASTEAPATQEAPVRTASIGSSKTLPSSSSSATARLSAVPTAQEPPSPSITPLELYRKANLARRAGKSDKAIEFFTELQASFPQSNEARLALVPFGNTLLDHGQAAAALKKFELYLRSGDSALSAEALYGQARALSLIGTKTAQSHAWRRLLERYPSSPYASTAQRKLEALR